MTESLLSSDGVTVASNLGKEIANSQTIEPHTGFEEVDDSLVLRRDASGRIITFDLEKYLPYPRHQRGDAFITDPASFAAYVTRLHGPGTTMWAEDRGNRITAVFNDHRNPETANDPFSGAGWRDHSAELSLVTDADWQVWSLADNRLMTQVDFGEFLENQAHTIADPPAAEMIQIATQLTAKRNLNFESGVRLESGDVRFEYREETVAKAGKLDVPQQFTIRLRPFQGTEMVEMTARLRHRIQQSGLNLGYKLLRADIVKKDAFADVVKKVSEATPESVPMYFGLRPNPLR